jgi:hypothetical protein
VNEKQSPHDAVITVKKARNGYILIEHKSEDLFTETFVYEGDTAFDGLKEKVIKIVEGVR